MSTAGAAIRGRDLAFAYPDASFRLTLPALDLAAGESRVCVGPSGSGKTTLLHLAAGILVPDAGTLEVLGTDLSPASEAGRSDGLRRRFRATHLGLVFQEFELLDHLTVLENVLLPYYVAPWLALTPAVRDRARGLASACGIERHLARRPRVLSHGERQRVAVCRGLVTEPALLLADEPTGNLDPATTDTVVDLLLEQVRARGVALLVVTHDHGLIGRFDGVVELGGKAVEAPA